MNYITNFPTYAKTSLTEDNNIYMSNTTPINEIERTICKILDKYSEMCKYYINIMESSITVSFNVGLDQYEAMLFYYLESDFLLFHQKLFSELSNPYLRVILKP